MGWDGEQPFPVEDTWDAESADSLGWDGMGWDPLVGLLNSSSRVRILGYLDTWDAEPADSLPCNENPKTCSACGSAENVHTALNNVCRALNNVQVVACNVHAAALNNVCRALDNVQVVACNVHCTKQSTSCN